jgi:uncharacterized protein
MDGLIWSDTIVAEAATARDRVAAELARAGVPGVLTVTGPAGMPGVLTRGDIDLHLRVEPDDFADAVTRLVDLYAPASRHSWADTLAVFEVPATRATGLAVTPVGSPHDRRFTRSWQRLLTDPVLLAAYNDLKRRYAGAAAYEEQKSAFFDRVASNAGHGRERPDGDQP